MSVNAECVNAEWGMVLEDHIRIRSLRIRFSPLPQRLVE
jgi:hypothetical protein